MLTSFGAVVQSILTEPRIKRTWNSAYILSVLARSVLAQLPDEHLGIAQHALTHGEPWLLRATARPGLVGVESACARSPPRCNRSQCERAVALHGRAR